MFKFTEACEKNKKREFISEKKFINKIKMHLIKLKTHKIFIKLKKFH